MATKAKRRTNTRAEVKARHKGAHGVMRAMSQPYDIGREDGWLDGYSAGYPSGRRIGYALAARQTVMRQIEAVYRRHDLAGERTHLADDARFWDDLMYGPYRRFARISAAMVSYWTTFVDGREVSW